MQFGNDSNFFNFKFRFSAHQFEIEVDHYVYTVKLGEISLHGRYYMLTAQVTFKF